MFLPIVIPYLIVMASTTGLSPSPSISSFLASATDRLYLWGGYGDAEPNTVYIYSVNTETWMREFTKEPHPPAGLCMHNSKIIARATK